MQKHLRDRQNLILDIYKAYYRAVVNKQMLDRARQILPSLRRVPILAARRKGPLRFRMGGVGA